MAWSFDLLLLISSFIPFPLVSLFNKRCQHAIVCWGCPKGGTHTSGYEFIRINTMVTDIIKAYLINYMEKDDEEHLMLTNS